MVIARPVKRRILFIAGKGEGSSAAHFLYSLFCAQKKISTYFWLGFLLFILLVCFPLLIFIPSFKLVLSSGWLASYVGQLELPA